MIKLGVTSIKQLLEGRDQTFLKRNKTVSIALYDQIPDLRDSERLAERILLQFSDDRGAFKRTYSGRFMEFDAKALDTILALAASDRDLIVHDVGQKFFLVRVAPAPVADGQHAGRDDFVKSGVPLPNGRGSDLQGLRR